MFSSRELASGIWIGLIAILIIVFGIRIEKFRLNLLKLLKIVVNKKMLIPFIIIFIYAIIWINLLSDLPFWNYKYIKDIILWVLFIGVPLCFNAVAANSNLYYTNVLKNNINYIIFIEFIVSTYTLSLIYEVFLVPFATLLVLFHKILKNDRKFKVIKRFFTFLQVLFGYTILYFAIKNMISNYDKLNKTELIITFSIPLIMTIIFLPLAYVYGLISSYEQLFLKMKFRLGKDKKINRKIKWKIILKCNLSLKKVNRFRKYSLKYMYINMSEVEINQLLDEFTNASG